MSDLNRGISKALLNAESQDTAAASSLESVAQALSEKLLPEPLSEALRERLGTQDSEDATDVSPPPPRSWYRRGLDRTQNWVPHKLPKYADVRDKGQAVLGVGGSVCGSLLCNVFPTQLIAFAKENLTEWFGLLMAVGLLLTMCLGHFWSCFTWLCFVGLWSKAVVFSGEADAHQLRHAHRLWLVFVMYEKLEVVLAVGLVNHPLYILFKWGTAHSLIDPEQAKRVWHWLGRAEHQPNTSE